MNTFYVCLLSIWSLYSSKHAQTTGDSLQGFSISYCSKSSVYYCYSLLTLSFQKSIQHHYIQSVVLAHVGRRLQLLFLFFFKYIFIFYLCIHSFPPEWMQPSPLSSLPLAILTACQKTLLAVQLWWARRDELGEDHKCDHVSFTPA